MVKRRLCCCDHFYAPPRVVNKTSRACFFTLLFVGIVCFAFTATSFYLLEKSPMGIIPLMPWFNSIVSENKTNGDPSTLTPTIALSPSKHHTSHRTLMLADIAVVITLSSISMIILCACFLTAWSAFACRQKQSSRILFEEDEQEYQSGSLDWYSAEHSCAVCF
jgi:hypothetical protein